ncbi:MAG TPA: GNAT family N-acetyltransferase [Solirubrobacteraceae bacterium]|nr:GNAT family N-acetyltransferase [Solirubrobacteraceae bacterium]
MVRTATPDDVPALAGALARAFDDDPITVFASPRAASRTRRTRFFFTGRLRALVGEELCFCDEERRGAALWAPPDRWRPSLREQLRLVRMVNHRTPWVVPGFLRMERLHPHEPHYYLSALGVAPEAQGRGLGSALLAPMLERCDREGVPAYLESSKERNIAFYGRHGFRVTRQMRFPRGPRLWLMWRDPR